MQNKTSSQLILEQAYLSYAILMYDFPYNYITNKNDAKAKLLFTEIIDSFMYEIET